MNKIEVIEKPLPQDVEAAYAQVRAGALLQIRSFKAVRSRAKVISNCLKAAAFGLLSLGIIVPVGSALVGAPFEKSGDVDPLEIGYIAIVLGGLCTLADQVFGFSQQHDRIRTVEMRLVAMLRDLDFGWSSRRFVGGVTATADPSADFQSLYDFRRMIDEANATQVAEWIAQRQAGSEILSNRLTAVPPRATAGSSS